MTASANPPLSAIPTVRMSPTASACGPSLMIAAGVNAKALSTYMGHANISITLDRYGQIASHEPGDLRRRA